MDPVRTQDQLSDFTLTSFEEDSSSDVVEMVIGGIAADIKNNASTSLPMVDIEDMLGKMADSPSSMPSMPFMPFMPPAPPVPPMPPAPPMPFMPMPGATPWGWPGRNDSDRERWEDYRSDMKAYWEQQREMQRSSMEAAMAAAKEWWGAFFGA